MDFLLKDRGSGKRTIKPSKGSEQLGAMIGAEPSDEEDSDFEVEKHKEMNSDHDSDDTGEECEGSEGSSSDSSDSDDGSDKEEESVEDELTRRSKLTTEELIALARLRVVGGGGGGKELDSKPGVCGTCLGENSDYSNEIVECDGCGVAVHEACYGIQETDSNTGSAASTEPWFCEPCMAGVVKPNCEVCPRIGGIYKETDVGNWIHLVCALYIPQISFFDQDRITKATLFELNYQHWGKRPCCLCKDVKFARTGLCIECDAGMCRQYFHVSCAQEAGLLSEPSDSDSEQFFGHCRAHTKPELLKRRRNNYLSHQLHCRGREAVIQAELEAGDVVEGEETPRQRISRKLRKCQQKWEGRRRLPGESWVPTQKMPRMLLTSSKAVRKLLRKNVLHGWNQRALDEEAHNQRVVAQIRRKWNVTPAWSVEFVAYYHDRGERIKEMQETLHTTVLYNGGLTEENAALEVQYRNLAKEMEEHREKHEKLRTELKRYRTVLARCDTLGRDLGAEAGGGGRAGAVVSPRQGHSNNRKGKTAVELLECAGCRSSRDQHMLAHCDSCGLDWHLDCLVPPLTKMPKNSKQWSWQCGDCDGKEVGSFDIPVQVDTSAPRASRARVSLPPTTDCFFSELEASPPAVNTLPTPPKKKVANKVQATGKGSKRGRQEEEEEEQQVQGGKRGRQEDKPVGKRGRPEGTKAEKQGKNEEEAQVAKRGRQEETQTTPNTRRSKQEEEVVQEVGKEKLEEELSSTKKGKLEGDTTPNTRRSRYSNEEPHSNKKTKPEEEVVTTRTSRRSKPEEDASSRKGKLEEDTTPKKNLSSEEITPKKGKQEEESVVSRRGKEDEETPLRSSRRKQEEDATSRRGRLEEETRKSRSKEEEETITTRRRKHQEEDPVVSTRKGKQEDETILTRRGRQEDETLSSRRGKQEEKVTSRKGKQEEEPAISRRGKQEEEPGVTRRGKQEEEAALPRRDKDKTEEEVVSSRRGKQDEEAVVSRRGEQEEETVVTRRSRQGEDTNALRISNEEEDNNLLKRDKHEGERAVSERGKQEEESMSSIDDKQEEESVMSRRGKQNIEILTSNRSIVEDDNTPNKRLKQDEDEAQGRKRGKHEMEEETPVNKRGKQEENPAIVTSPKITRRNTRKSKQSTTDSPSEASPIAEPPESPPTEPPSSPLTTQAPSLPPKKFFKTREQAASSCQSGSTQIPLSNESTNFKQWLLETKGIPPPLHTEQSPSKPPHTQPPSPHTVVNQPPSPKSLDTTAATPQSLPPEPLSTTSSECEPSSCKATDTNIAAPPPVTPILSSQTNGVTSHHTEAEAEAGSSEDEAGGSPEKGDSNLSGTVRAGEEVRDQARIDARNERKRLKREEKEKRREERRKKKMLLRADWTDGDDIEEDEDGNCVIRITPKPVQPIKLKIKPIVRPEQNVPPPATADQSPPNYPMMHPKKKIAHMDMAEVTGTMVQQPRNGSSSTLEPESPPAVSSTTTDLNCDGMSLSPKTLAPASPKVAVTTSATSSVVNPVVTAPTPVPPRTVELRANGIGGSHSSPTPPPPVTTPKPSTSSSSSSRSSTTVKKPGGREPRTRCDVCSGDGTNANLVRCDECYKCYHFSCLMPPVKKTPKVSGWSWSCSDCAPSDEDKSWHL